MTLWLFLWFWHRMYATADIFRLRSYICANVAVLVVLVLHVYDTIVLMVMIL